MQLTSLVLSERTYKMDNVSLRQIINRIPLLRYRCFGSFPSDFVPVLPNETFAFMNKQPTNMQSGHWIMIANSCRKLYFEDSLGRPSFKQQYQRMMPQPLHFHHSVCVFYTLYAVFQICSSNNKKILELTMSMLFQL